MAIAVDVQRVASEQGVPESGEFSRWAEAALHGRRDNTELTIRIVDEEEGATLNQHWRGGSGATNVLSFPYEPIPGVEIDLLGDIVICAPVVRREAGERSISAQAHWAHLVVHGVLHLLGYDHELPPEAADMEQLEAAILDSLGYADPYEAENHNG